MKQALDGVRVLDATQVMAGPFCTMLLGDLGADVVKVEPPGGDSTRTMALSQGTESPGFWGVNRNKRGIVLNLKEPAAQEIFRSLAARADILVENYRPGAMDALGLGHAELRRRTRPWSTRRSRASAPLARTRCAGGSTWWRRGCPASCR